MMLGPGRPMVRSDAAGSGAGRRTVMMMASVLVYFKLPQPLNRDWHCQAGNLNLATGSLARAREWCHVYSDSGIYPISEDVWPSPACPGIGGFNFMIMMTRISANCYRAEYVLSESHPAFHWLGPTGLDNGNISLPPCFLRIAGA
jgi:hypothetical protein